MVPLGVQSSNSATLEITGGSPGEKVSIHPKKEDQERGLGLCFSFGLKRNHDSGGISKLLTGLAQVLGD